MVGCCEQVHYYFTGNIGNTVAVEGSIYWAKKPLSTSKNVLFPGHNYLLSTGADDPVTGWPTQAT